MKSGNLQENGTGYIGVAKGTTAQRPSSPVNGMIRYNTDLGYLETYDNGWGPVDSNNAFSPGFKTGAYYGSPPVDYNTITSQYFASGTIFAMPFYIPVGGDFNRVGINVGTAGFQSSLRIGIYNNLNGEPDTLLYDLGTVATTSTGDKEITFANASALHGQWIWVSIILSLGVNLMAYGFTNNGGALLGRDTSSTYGTALGMQGAGTGTTLPSSFPTTTQRFGTAPYIWIRKV